MKYDTLVKYFESKEGIEVDLIRDYRPIFDMIDEVGSAMLQGVLSTSDQYKEALNQFTGAYVSLEPLYTLAESHKANEELRFYVEKKREMESSGEKIVAASLDKEASASVASFRRIRNVLEGYVLATEKGIITCQTQLKNLTQDLKYKPQEES